MPYELIAILAAILAVGAQGADVLTTNIILALPGGYEKNKLLATLQAKTGKYWGPITLAAVVIILGGAFVTTGTQGVIVISIPLAAYSAVIAYKNLQVIRRLEAAKRIRGLL